MSPADGRRTAPSYSGSNPVIPAERLISEPVTPDAETFDTQMMAAGVPGLPKRFVWRGKSYTVSRVLKTWTTLRNCRNGSGEKYRNKHFFEIETGGGEVMTLYHVRRSGRDAVWTLYTMRDSQAALKRLRIGVLVSGSGTNLQALIDAQARQNCPYTIELVISDRKNAYALQRAQTAGIPTELALPLFSAPHPGQEEQRKAAVRRAVSDTVLELAKRENLDALVLAGFLTILAGAVVDEYSGRIINLHPALLPKYGGPGMYGRHVHEAVLNAGETESGCTVHLVDAGCDTGPVLLRRTVPVLPGDTPDTLAGRIHEQEHIAIVEGVDILAERLNGHFPA